jgi:hypothetical protein
VCCHSPSATGQSFGLATPYRRRFSPPDLSISIA